MITAFFTVLLKVAVMLILIAVGWLLTKNKMLGDQGTKDITNLSLYVVSPCLTVSSFMTADMESVTTENLLLALLGAVLAMGIAILISQFCYRKSPDEEKRTVRYALVFSNCGFMGIPLVQSILGSQAVVYCTPYIAVFNFLTWTYGYVMMSSNSRMKPLQMVKKGILNPGVIGIFIGLAIFLLKIEVPEVIASPIEFFGDMNTPLAMLIVGNNIAKVRIRDVFSEKKVYSVALLRLFILPLLALPFLLLLHPVHDVFLTTLLQAASPVAANTVIFSVMFNRDARLGSKLVASSTILSLISIPILVMVAEALFGLI